MQLMPNPNSDLRPILERLNAHESISSFLLSPCVRCLATFYSEVPMKFDALDSYQ